MSKFKKGDRVKLIDNPTWSISMKGVIGTVVNTHYSSGKGKKPQEGNMTILIDGRVHPQVWFENFWEKLEN